MPALVIFQYEADVPSQWQWQAGIQMALPWASSLDVSYVGNHGFNRLGDLQGGTTVNLNAVDIGAAYLPQNQDPTLGTSAVPGGAAYVDNLLRAYRGLGNINQNTTDFWDDVPLDPDVAQPPVPQWLLVRGQLHLGHLAQGQHRPAAPPAARARRQLHAPAPTRRPTRS